MTDGTRPQSRALEPHVATTPESDGASQHATRVALPGGGGEAGALMRAFDWSATPLGAPDQWPQSLRTVVHIILTSRYAMWMGWGPELSFFYNDAYRPTLGVKHPWALGTPARDVWAEIWQDIEPRIRTVMETGVATWDEALLLFLERSGYPEETYHTFSYSPLTDDSGAVSGLFCVVTEETERVIGERRLASLRDLASALASAHEEEEVLDAITRAVGANQKDLPFTLTYLFDESGREARLACSTGIQAGVHWAAPVVIPVNGVQGVWPASDVLANGVPIVVRDALAGPEELPTGEWDRPARGAIVVPIAQRGQDAPAGFLVAGVNPYRQLDVEYAGFVNLVAGQISSSLANARAYAQEKRRAEALAEIDRAKTAFFSNVSHEFRTPLTLLLGPMEESLRRSDLSPATREDLGLAHRNALRLLKLVNSLLDFSRIEAGRIEVAYEATELAGYTADLASTFRSALERAGLELSISVQPLAEPVYVDRDMWEKIVLNLLSNAFKHTFEGEIAVRLFRRDGDAVLEVEDSGIGIAPEQLPHIFDRFHRVPNAQSRTHEGTGIGLSLVRELVRHLGGRIEVQSVVGSGTKFSVALPLGDAHLPSGRADAARARKPSAMGAAPFVEEALRWLPGAQARSVEPARPPRISDERAGQAVPSDRAGVTSSTASTGSEATWRVLLADDNADMRDYATRLLREQGWEVEAVADGLAALETARRWRPDLVLSDVMMPGLDGFSLLRALRADPSTSTTPVILLSARAGEEARVEGAHAGADDYLVKPFSAQELVARVGAHLSLARERARATAAVEAARDLLTRVLEQAPVAICMTRGPEHRFELANPFYQRLLPRREIIGRRAIDVIPELQAQGLVSVLDEVFTSGCAWSGSGVPLAYDRHGDGVQETAYFNAYYHPFADADGKTVGVIAVCLDVTDQVLARRDAEAARSDAETARQVAEAANRAKSQFLAVMSHELRTPLNAIAGHVQLMDMEIHGPITAPQRDALARVERSQRHLLRLINDVLNLARIETGRVDYQIEDVAIQHVAADLAPMIEPQLAGKELLYEVRLPEEPLIVHADREKVGQVLLNLLSNAVKFTPPGGRVTLDATTRESVPDTVFVRVTDTGVGVPPEKQSVIFEPFVQVQTGPTRATDGAGLGLAISRDLARGMGGDLRVRSIEGVGATFTLSLPTR